MIRFRATIDLDNEELAETILKSTAIENRGYVDMRREGNMLEITFEAKDYGSFLHTFNDLFVSILMILKL